MKPGIAAREWIWVGIVGALILLATSTPYLIGLSAGEPDWTFGGFLFGVEDMHSYLAKMRYGAYDGWQFRLVYTTEPHPGGFVFGFHLALGKLAAAIAGGGGRVSAAALVITYHAARLVCGAILLVVLYRFAAEYLEPPPQRRLAWILAALAGGLGWIPLVVALAQGGVPADRLPVEFYVPEGFTLLTLYGLPHLALARSLLLAGWLLLLRSVDGGHPRPALLAGLAWLAMGVLVPFYAALLGALIGFWLGGCWLAQRRFPAAALRLSALAGVLPLIVLIYNAWLFARDPVFAAWSAQNRLPSPPPGDYVLAYGLLAALAVPGFLVVWRSGWTPRRVLLVIWPPLALLLAYLPINVQRRLLEGLIAPLCILVTLGLWRLVGEKPASGEPGTGWRLRQLLAGLALMTLFPSPVLLISGGALTALRPRWPIYHPADEVAALDWLRVRAAPGEVVLSAYESGNVLPAYAPVRVYVGHGPETVRADAKRAQAEAFFAGALPADQQAALLRDSGAAYVWLGPPEQAVCSGASSCLSPEALGLREAFRAGRYTIYEVER